MDTAAGSVDRLDALDPDFLDDEQAAARAGWQLLTIELPAEADPREALARIADAAEECAQDQCVAWHLPDPSSVVPGPFTLVIGISGSDQVDTLERAQWLEDEIGALDPDGAWLILPGLA